MVIKALLAAAFVAALSLAAPARAVTFSEAVTTCGRWVQQHYSPAFEVFQDSPDTVRMLGTVKARFEFHRCMNFNGIPMDTISGPHY